MYGDLRYNKALPNSSFLTDVVSFVINNEIK